MTDRVKSPERSSSLDYSDNESTAQRSPRANESGDSIDTSDIASPYRQLSPSSPSPEKLTEATLLLQRVLRGTATRRSYVNPTEGKELQTNVIQALEKAGISTDNPTALSKAIAAEILASTDPAYQGHGKFETHNRQQENPIEFWTSRKGNKVKIRLIGEEIGKGTLKQVLKAQEIEIELSAPKAPTVSQPTGLAAVRFKAEHIDNVLRGQRLVLQRLGESPDLKYLAVDLTETDRMLPTSEIDARDNLYEGSLHSFYDAMLVRNDDNIRYGLNKNYFTWLDEEHAAGRTEETSEGYKEHIRDCFHDLAKGLKALHSVGLVHGDMKPANVLVTPDGADVKLKIGDLDGVNALGQPPISFTPAYMDNLALRGIVSPFTDIYALALMAKDYFVDAMPEETKTLIDAVLKANNETFAWLSNREDNHPGPAVYQKLKNGTEAERAEAFQQLNTQFPAFNKLLDALSVMG